MKKHIKKQMTKCWIQNKTIDCFFFVKKRFKKIKKLKEENQKTLK